MKITQLKNYAPDSRKIVDNLCLLKSQIIVAGIWKVFIYLFILGPAHYLNRTELPFGPRDVIWPEQGE